MNRITLAMLLLLCYPLLAKPTLTEQISTQSAHMAANFINNEKFEYANYFLNFALALDNDSNDALTLQGRLAYDLKPKQKAMTDDELGSYLASLKSIGSKQADQNRKRLFYLLYNLINDSDEDVLVYLQKEQAKKSELNIYKLLTLSFKYEPSTFELLKGVKADLSGESGAIKGRIIDRVPTQTIRPPKTKDLWWVRFKESGDVATHNTNCVNYGRYEEPSKHGTGGKGRKGVNCQGCGGSKPASWKPNYYLPRGIDSSIRPVQLLKIHFNKDRRRYYALYRLKKSWRLSYEWIGFSDKSVLLDYKTMERVNLDDVFKKYEVKR